MRIFLVPCGINVTLILTLIFIWLCSYEAAVFFFFVCFEFKSLQKARAAFHSSASVKLLLCCFCSSHYYYYYHCTEVKLQVNISSFYHYARTAVEARQKRVAGKLQLLCLCFSEAWSLTSPCLHPSPASITTLSFPAYTLFLLRSQSWMGHSSPLCALSDAVKPGQGSEDCCGAVYSNEGGR